MRISDWSSYVCSADLVVGLTALIKHSIDAADDMSKLARSTGLTTEALSQLSYAADLSGVENLGDALNKFNKNIGEAAKGSKAQADAFAEIGRESCRERVCQYV